MEEVETPVSKKKVDEQIKGLQDILAKFKKEIHTDISLTKRPSSVEERFAAVERRLDSFEKSLNKVTTDLSKLQTGTKLPKMTCWDHLWTTPVHNSDKFMCSRCTWSTWWVERPDLQERCADQGVRAETCPEGCRCSKIYFSVWYKPQKSSESPSNWIFETQSFSARIYSNQGERLGHSTFTIFSKEERQGRRRGPSDPEVSEGGTAAGWISSWILSEYRSST